MLHVKYTQKSFPMQNVQSLNANNCPCQLHFVWWIKHGRHVACGLLSLYPKSSGILLVTYEVVYKATGDSLVDLILRILIWTK